MSNLSYLRNGAYVFSSLEEALSQCPRLQENQDLEAGYPRSHDTPPVDIFIIGGASLYEEALGSELCGRVFLTRVDASVELEESCDAFFGGWRESMKEYEQLNMESVHRLLKENMHSAEQSKSNSNNSVLHELSGCENGLTYEFEVWQRKKHHSS